MPPKKHYAKSQEFVYKSVGKGSRQKYRLVATDIPRNVGETSHTAAQDTPVATLPPGVSSPTDAAGFDQLQDPTYFDTVNEVKPKKSGKVSPNVKWNPYELMKWTPASEAIRLHEDMAGAETGEILEPNHRYGSWSTARRKFMSTVPHRTGGMEV
jgi:hypothetical protein